MKKIYSWKEHANMPIKADVAAKELEKIKEKRGKITPSIIVESARSKKSPLHTCFEWDDGLAAEKYRIEQAKFMIRKIAVRIEKTDVKPVRAYVSVQDNEQPAKKHYDHVCRVLSAEETRAELLSRAWKELIEWKARYQHLSEFAQVIAVINPLSMNFAVNE
jgi:hypothetical protein